MSRAYHHLRLRLRGPLTGARSVSSNAASDIPNLDVDLTRRERQLLNVLYRSHDALRHRQLAALVWSDPARTHDVRTGLYRLRRTLRDSGWTIPVPPNGQGVRLVGEDVVGLAA